jgi:hypothetical protein
MLPNLEMHVLAAIEIKNTVRVEDDVTDRPL